MKNCNAPKNRTTRGYATHRVGNCSRCSFRGVAGTTRPRRGSHSATRARQPWGLTEFSSSDPNFVQPDKADYYFYTVSSESG